MSAARDKFGRPIVVVTGMGVVTSLGAGKEDNWRKLTAGESGIRTVTRFPVEGLKSTMAGTVDFVSVDPVTSTGLTERLAEMATERSARAGSDRRQGRFPRAAVSGGRAGRGRMAAAARARARDRKDRVRLWRHTARQRRRPVHVLPSPFHVRLGGEPSGRYFWHQGLADLALNGVRLRRDRDPARRRGDPPRRRGCGALRGDRRLGQSGSSGAVLAAVGAIDAERSAAGRLKTVLEEPRRFCDGGRRRRDGAGKLRVRRWRAAQKFSAWSPAAAN